MPLIPKKAKTVPVKYYKIGEASKILDVKPFVIRFWEEQFTINTFKKKVSKQRRYSEADLDLLKKIKELLYEKKFTILGAIKVIKFEKETEKEVIPQKISYNNPENEKLLSIKKKLQIIYDKIPCFSLKVD